MILQDETQIQHVMQLSYLAMSSANFKANVGFKAPLLFKNARRSPYEPIGNSNITCHKIERSKEDEQYIQIQ